MADQGATELSLEETNRMRISLGLAPITNDSGGVVDKDQEARDNWQHLEDERIKANKEKGIRDRIEKSKTKKQLAAKLAGKSLGEADDVGESALDWIRRSRQREKEKALAAKRAKELEEMDETFENGRAEYSSADLQGLRIDHSMDNFDEGGETILTLKDRGILDEDEEGDELTNVNLEERERLQKNLENRRKKPGYTGYDDEEFTLGSQKKSLLSQYDEETKKKGLRIGSGGGIKSAEEEKQAISDTLRAQAIDLNYEKMRQIEDYNVKDDTPVSFKKTKKKKKVRRRATEDTNDEDGLPATLSLQDGASPAPMDEDIQPSTNSYEQSFVDDEDLQASLARSRREALKKQKAKSSVQAIAQTLREMSNNVSDTMSGGVDDDDIDGGLIISDTTEFVNQLPTAAAMAAEALEREREREAKAQSEADRLAALNTASIAEAEDAAKSLSPDADQDMDMDSDHIQNGHKEQNLVNIAPIEEEPLVSSGMAATLALLSQKGIYQKPTKEQLEKDKAAAERSRWIAEQRKRDAQREQELQRERKRDKERDGGGSNRQRRGDVLAAREREREREQEIAARERERAREMVERMANYTPEVNLSYTDETGRQLSTKEAWRQLSHKFHGKTSGKLKTEKRLRKLEEEKMFQTMASSDTPLNMATAFQERQKAAGSAHVVLSVGNRGVLPTPVTQSISSTPQPSMEDAHTTLLDLDDKGHSFFAVYDGHGGATVAKYCGEVLHNQLMKEKEWEKGNYEEAIRNAYLDLDSELKEDPAFATDTAGCTAVSATLTPNDVLWVGNAGDSRAIVSRRGQAMNLSDDHKPNNWLESDRIVRAGGFVEFGRVNGNLALSRAIGDFEFKQNKDLPAWEQTVTALPDIMRWEMRDDDHYIVLACDGKYLGFCILCIWDCMTSQQVVDFINNRIRSGSKPEQICEELMDECLATESDMSGVGCDNMTVIIVAWLNGLSIDEWMQKVIKQLDNEEEETPKKVADDKDKSKPILVSEVQDATADAQPDAEMSEDTDETPAPELTISPESSKPDETPSN
ncbi:hypothetical protein BZG36_02661 [Bifiguratus adelaidae]|uniref:PPM-type phosphatase domain-containing protein n=1 Tax=Bifiguratus adelaidae TaxID=1938954 RepID=A0A261Y374_9FUNG|nr:hypothetical protein BZG36_02661 [Bifiguratus adelaidae]